MSDPLQLPPRNDVGSAPPRDLPRVSAVMPCLNEEKTIALCIGKAMSCFARLGISGEVVVADNGSSDRSVELADAAGARVVHVATKGYGAALCAGIQAARGNIIIMGDSDDSYDWSSLDRFIAEIESGNELVMGNRFRGGIEPGAMPPLHRYFGNPILSLISRIAFRIPIGDFHCGMRAFTADAFRKLGLKSTGMEFATEMVESAARHRLRITEIPIKLYPDKRGRPPHLRSFRDGWRHLRFILSHAPDYVCLWPGFAMLGAGATLMLGLVGGPIVLAGHYLGVHFMVLGAMLALIGGNVLTMGILGKMILGISPANKSPAVRRLFAHSHLLEWVLAGGAMLFLVGLATDSVILARWLRGGAAPMEDTIHLAIAASTLVVLGVEVMFAAFLIFLVHSQRQAIEPESGR
jgi:glycosyltransferase involved in cell wall biosynthesis